MILLGCELAVISVYRVAVRSAGCDTSPSANLFACAPEGARSLRRAALPRSSKNTITGAKHPLSLPAAARTCDQTRMGEVVVS